MEPWQIWLLVIFFPAISAGVLTAMAVAIYELFFLIGLVIGLICLPFYAIFRR